MSKPKELTPIFPDWSLFPARWPDLFERFFAPFQRPGPGDGWNPRAELKETPEAYVLTVELPGLKSEDVKVTVLQDTIHIQGEKREEKVENEQGTHVCERTYGAFQRTLQLPTPVKDDDVDAEMKNGVLVLKVKKTQVSQPRKIKVRG